ncbi:MAG: efflux RND transporter permease subunit, partial [SAR324 cluster bacterium]|nr:efflux RND transporter permease subunit [SAR324 cluster bacterium]
MKAPPMLEEIIAYFAKRHILTNLIMVVVLGGGVVAWNATSKEEMPDITFDRVRISVIYPGAPAGDVEYFVARPIEAELQGLDGVYRITSTCNVGRARISVELEQGYPDKDEAITAIRNAVMDVKLPAEVVDEPRVRVFKPSKKAILDVALFHKKAPLLDTEKRRELQR